MYSSIPNEDIRALESSTAKYKTLNTSPLFLAACIKRRLASVTIVVLPDPGFAQNKVEEPIGIPFPSVRAKSSPILPVSMYSTGFAFLRALSNKSFCSVDNENFVSLFVAIFIYLSLYFFNP